MNIRKTEAARAFDALLGRGICAARKQREMTAAQLAVAAGITTGALYRYEAGWSSCSAHTLVKIAVALRMPVSGLICMTRKS